LQNDALQHVVALLLGLLRTTAVRLLEVLNE
jgi:hypothetical protein